MQEVSRFYPKILLGYTQYFYIYYFVSSMMEAMMLKTFPNYLSFGKIQEDMRKAGLRFIMTRIIALFLKRLASINLAIWLTLIGFVIWPFRLIKKP